MAAYRPLVRIDGETHVLPDEDRVPVAAIEGAVATDDPRLSNSREWTAETVSQAEAEAGTATTRRAWTAQRVRQAIIAWWNTVGTTVGKALLNLTNPSAISFLRVNADNSVTARNATDFRADIGANSATNLTTGTLPAARFNDTAHGNRAGGALHALATGSAHGFFSSTDFTKLAGIAPGATANTGTVTSVGLSVPTGFSVADSPVTGAGTLTLTFAAGYQGYTTAEATKLAGIADNANNYTLPAATATALGGIELFSNTVQAVAANAVSATAARTYGVQLNADGQAVVNVPWADTNTTYSGSTSITLSGTSFQRAALTGDVTASANSNATTIANNAVSNAKLADMAASTIKGRVTASTGDPEDLTAAQARALLNVADGATTNQSDSFLLDRANHTGSQSISTVSGLESILDAKADKTTTFTAGTGLSGGGDLSANRSFSVLYGTTAGTAAEGNDVRLSNSREWTGSTISQAEAEAGTATTRRAFTALRVRQAIIAWWNGSAEKTKLDGIATGATANQSDAYLLNRANHTGTQAHTTITGLGTAATEDSTAFATAAQGLLAEGAIQKNTPYLSNSAFVHTNRMFSRTNTSAAYYILVGRIDTGSNYCVGRFYAARSDSSSNRNSAIMDVICRDSSSANKNFSVTMQSVQGITGFDRVTLTYGGVSYFAIRFNQTEFQQFDWILFNGMASQNLIAVVEDADVTDVTVLTDANNAGSAIATKGIPQLTTGDGSANRPAYSFYDDPDNGMYRLGTNQIGFSTDGTTRLSLSTTEITVWSTVDLKINKQITFNDSTVAANTRNNLGAASTAVATTSANGLMSAADKSKLDFLPSHVPYVRINFTASPKTVAVAGASTGITATITSQPAGGYWSLNVAFGAGVQLKSPFMPPFLYMMVDLYDDNLYMPVFAVSVGSLFTNWSDGNFSMEGATLNDIQFPEQAGPKPTFKGYIFFQ